MKNEPDSWWVIAAKISVAALLLGLLLLGGVFDSPDAAQLLLGRD